MLWATIIRAYRGLRGKVIRVGALIQESRRLSVLNLDNTGLRGNHLVELSEALMENRGLRQLSLSANDFDVPSLLALNRASAANTSLCVINIGPMVCSVYDILVALDDMTTRFV